MKTIIAGDLNIAFEEAGPVHGTPVILLHGFPYDIHSYDVVAERLAEQNVRCFIPYLRGYGPTRFIKDETPRSGQQAAIAADLLAFMDALSIPKAVLGGYDWGGRAACIVAALWPERVTGLVSCGQGYNIQDIANAWQPADAETEARFWYQYYFNTRRGEVGLQQNRNALCRHIWDLWSPSWNFDEAIYQTTAVSFENPDFVETVIHSYRHRFGEVAGDPQYDAIENQLATLPAISVPTVVMQGRDDGVDPPPSEDLARRHFSKDYQRIVADGVGHNFPQESPALFAEAILSLTHPN